MKCLLCDNSYVERQSLTSLLLLKPQKRGLCSTCQSLFEVIPVEHCPTCYKPFQKERCPDCQK